MEEKKGLFGKSDKKEKMNIIVFSCLMLVIFVITFYGIHIFLSDFFYNNVSNNIYFKDIIFESILAILSFLVLLFWKNSYVFQQKCEKFIPSLRYGWFYLLFGGFFFLISIKESFVTNTPGVINLAIFCLLIGLYEEFLCRGWLLNEFLERYGESKKGIWTSIIVSGVIFGLIHFINLSSQDLASTITQVFSASATGVVFGVIYYRTKNIWTVVFLHAFWDFALMLNTVFPVTSVSEVISSVSYLGIVFSLLTCISELLVLLPFIKDIDADVKNNKLFWTSFIASFGFFISLILSLIGDVSGEVFKIGNISMREYSVLNDNYETYELKEKIEINDGYDNYKLENYSLSFYKTNSLLTLKNNITGKDISFEYDYLYDYGLYEFGEYYIIAYINLDNDGNNQLYYNYILKSELSNEDDFLEVIKNNMNYHLIESLGDLCIIHDKESNKEYLAVDTDDYGYFVLVEDGNVSLLNRN